MSSFSTLLAGLHTSLSTLTDLVPGLATLVANQLSRTLRSKVVCESTKGTRNSTFVLIGTASSLVSCLFAVETNQLSIDASVEVAGSNFPFFL